MKLCLTIHIEPMSKNSDRSRLMPIKHARCMIHKATGKKYYLKSDLYISHYQPPEIHAWMMKARRIIYRQLPRDFIKWDGAIRVNRLEYFFPPLKAFSNVMLAVIDKFVSYKATKPDIDNVQKLLWDSLQDVVFTNDSRIVEMNQVRKRYSTKPRIELELEFLTLNNRGVECKDLSTEMF